MAYASWGSNRTQPWSFVTFVVISKLEVLGLGRASFGFSCWVSSNTRSERVVRLHGCRVSLLVSSGCPYLPLRPTQRRLIIQYLCSWNVSLCQTPNTLHSFANPWTAAAHFGEAINGEKLIGSTVIDLEDLASGVSARVDVESTLAVASKQDTATAKNLFRHEARRSGREASRHTSGLLTFFAFALPKPKRMILSPRRESYYEAWSHICVCVPCGSDSAFEHECIP